MKITKIDVYNFDLTYVHGVYVMSGAREITSLPSTLVRITSDAGYEGWGEVCPLGSAYLPQHAGGARARHGLRVEGALDRGPRRRVARERVQEGRVEVLGRSCRELCAGFRK